MIHFLFYFRGTRLRRKIKQYLLMYKIISCYDLSRRDNIMCTYKTPKICVQNKHEK